VHLYLTQRIGFYPVCRLIIWPEWGRRFMWLSGRKLRRTDSKWLDVIVTGLVFQFNADELRWRLKRHVVVQAGLPTAFRS